MISLVAKGEGLATESPGTIGEIADAVGKNDGSVLGDSIAKGKLPPLFDAGYCDVMPVDEAQLATQRAYIRSNPRSRLMRTTYRSWLQPQRHTVDTLLLTPWGFRKIHPCAKAAGGTSGGVFRHQRGQACAALL